ATPDEGWGFVEWTGTDQTGEEITVTMDEDKNITAHFEQVEEYDLTINIDGEGTVEVDGTEVEDGWTETYGEGTTVELAGMPSEGWEFVEWTGDETGTETPMEITMDENKSITAVFEEEGVYYTLTVNIDGEGEVDVTPDQEEYEEGTEVTLEATPAEGWGFVEWTGTDQTGESITITMDEDKAITAVFEEVITEEYELEIKIKGEGEVSLEPDQDRFENGTDVILTAESAEGWKFVEWTGDHEGTGEELWITIDENMTITAHFEEEGGDEKGFLDGNIWLGVVIAVAALVLVGIGILVKRQAEKDGEDQEEGLNEFPKEGGSEGEDIEEQDMEEDLEKKVEDILDEGSEEDG
ncbi:MAG: hypothetical protein V5A88_05740, partial [Candidatus Thermoplasmatota archaeon]